MIQATCACGESTLVPPPLAGKHIKCPKCGEMVTIPGNSTDS